MTGILGVASLKIVEEQFGMLSEGGIILAISLAAFALLGAFLAPFWFPRLSAWLSKNDRTRWLSSSQYGRLLPFVVGCLLFPLCGLFSSNAFSFWIFLLFGWGAAAILLYCGAVVDMNKK